MNLYTIELSPEALKTLRRMRDRRLHERLTEAIGTLASEPHPPGAKKMAGTPDEWRIRVGEWRVIYRIEDGRLVVLVLRVAPRGDVYR
jgi:mRNA interferase RelE/StbE